MQGALELSTSWTLYGISLSDDKSKVIVVGHQTNAGIAVLNTETMEGLFIAELDMESNYRDITSSGAGLWYAIGSVGDYFILSKILQSSYTLSHKIGFQSSPIKGRCILVASNLIFIGARIEPLSA